VSADGRASAGEGAWAPGGFPDGQRIPRQRDRREPARTRVLIAVGTDKHPFDRLVTWIQLWHREAAGRVSLTVQHGHTRPPTVPGAVPFLGHAELQDEMARADLVVCHGGPATILEARRHGHLPIVVPRDPSLGEHVDNHQQLFARRLGAAGKVALCESREALLGALGTGLDEPGRFAVAEDRDAVAAQLAAVHRVGQIVESLVAAAGRGERRSWWQRRAAARPNGENGR
jgi:UDP-N-acetylglucosamine transferase subunit ALG13